MTDLCRDPQVHIWPSGEDCSDCTQFLNRIEQVERDISAIITGKQNTLTAGDHITIAADGTISGECCSRAELLTILGFDPANYYTKAQVDEIIQTLLAGNPVILGLLNSVVAVGSTFDPMAGVSAWDSDGNDVTSSVTVTGTVDTSTAGTYTLTYSVTVGTLTTTKTRTVIVE